MNKIQTSQFRVGEQIVLDNKFGVIKLFDTDVAAIFIDDKTLIQYTVRELLSLFKDGRLQFLRPVVETVATDGKKYRLTDANKKEIAIRTNYCRALHGEATPGAIDTRKRVILEVMQRHHYAKGPSHQTYFRWYHRWREDEFDMAIQVVGGRKEHIRTSDEANALLDEITKKFYMNKKYSVEATYREYKKAYDKLNFQENCISKSTVSRRIKKLNRIDVIDKREGRSAAREASRITLKGYESTRPLERVELDAAHFNLPLLNDEGYYVGCMTMYFVICTTTRVILGYAITVGKKGENSNSVAHSIINSTLVKADPNYPWGGIADEYVCDGGSAYLAELIFELVEKKLNSSLTVCPVRMGWGKPFVESYVRTIRQKFFKQCQGYLGKYESGKYQEKTLIKSAKLTVNQAITQVANYIRDEYHHEKHSGLNGRTPAQAWDDFHNNNDEFIAPTFAQDLGDYSRFKGLLVKNRKLNGVKGIFYCYQWYHSQELSDMYHSLHSNTEQKQDIFVDINVNTLDAREIDVINLKTGEIVTVAHARGLNYPVSFAELNAERNGIQVSEEFGVEIKDGIYVKPSTTKYKFGTEIPVADASHNPEDFFESSEDESFQSSTNKPYNDASSFNTDDEDDDTDYMEVEIDD